MNSLSVRPTQVKNIMLRAIKAKRPIFIWGPPGIGKSELVADVANSGILGNATVIDLRLALLEPTDIRGYPFRNAETNTMEWSPPADLPSNEWSKKYDTIILFLDELNSAPPSVQSAAYQLILNRRVGQYALPDNVMIVAAGNRENDRGVTYRMPAPLANRFRHVNMTVDFNDWSSWAINHNIHPDVIGYLTYAKQDLFEFDPKTSSHAFATPRSWSYVSEILFTPGFDNVDSFEQKAEVAGAIGDGMATKFIEHRRIAAYLPSPDDVIKGKAEKLDNKLSQEISAKYSLVIGLAYEINQLYKKSKDSEKFKLAFNNAVRFSFNNFEPEMIILFFKTIMTDYKIKFNVQDDLDKDLLKIFSQRYRKYIV